jgi:hypothetical protein
LLDAGESHLSSATHGKKEAKSLFSKKHNLIYDMEKCHLYIDLNGKKQGLGGGGLLAQFEKGTMLEKDDFLLMPAAMNGLNNLSTDNLSDFQAMSA